MWKRLACLVFPHVRFDVENTLFDSSGFEEGIFTGEVIVDFSVEDVGLTGDKAVEVAGDKDFVVATLCIVVVEVVGIGTGKEVADAHVVHGNPETGGGVALHLAVDFLAVLVNEGKGNDAHLHTGVLFVDIPILLDVDFVVIVGGEVFVLDGVVAFVDHLTIIIVNGVGGGGVGLVEFAIHDVPINRNLQLVIIKDFELTISGVAIDEVGKVDTTLVVV